MNADATKKAAFMAAVRGIPTHHVTKALNTLTWGTDWARCSKSLMADCYAGSPSTTGSVTKINLDLLKARATARMKGDQNWREAKVNT